jgi:hypothetical protein
LHFMLHRFEIMGAKEVVQETLEMGASGALGKCWGSKMAES